MQKTLIFIGVLISIFFSKNLTAAEPLECLKDAKAPEVIQNEKGFYWRGMLMKFACWPVFVYAFLLTILNRKIPYLPTSKDGSVKLSVFVWPHFIYLFLLISAIAYHYQVGIMFKEGIQGFLLKRQTLGMLSFSILAAFQTLFSIVIIFRSMKSQSNNAWNEIYH